MEELNFTIQEGNALHGTCEKYPASDSVDGISAEQIQSLQAGIDDASAKGTAQEKAMDAVGTLTDLQNKSKTKAIVLINKAKNAARSVYGEDNKAKMREFHVGTGALETVKAILSELKYMKSVATDYKADLAKGGLKDSDIANFDTVSAELSGNDVEQENAKKVQKAATGARDASLKALQKTMRSIRNSAKTIFADRPDVLIEFEPISRGRTGAKTQPPTPAPSTTSK